MPPMPVKKAPQTRDVDVVLDFLRRLQKAFVTWEYAPVEAMLAPQAVVRLRQGELSGVDAIIGYLKNMGTKSYRFAITAPKGGLCTVNVSEPMVDSQGQTFEQIYHVRGDKVVEIIDMGRTLDMVYRPLSQPN